ncbi:MAG: hypothetical protein ACRDLB_01690, partial [Actinomycetota bacterium]
MRRGGVLVTLVGALLLPTAAQAGGWWSYVDVKHSYVAIGGRVVVNSAHMFGETTDDVHSGKIVYYAYLVRDFNLDMAYDVRDPGDGRWWSSVDGPMVKLGALDVDGTGVSRVRGSFVVPEVAPGRYWLMLCDDGCDRAMADAVPARLHVVESSALARAASRAEKLTFDVRMLRVQLRHQTRTIEQRFDERLERARSATGDVKGALAATDRRVRQLTAELRARDGDITPILFALFGLMFGAGVVALVMRKTKETAGPAPTPGASPGPLGEYVVRSRPARSGR